MFPFVSNFANPNSLIDVIRFGVNPNLQSAAGIAGTVVGAPEMGVSEGQVLGSSTSSNTQNTTPQTPQVPYGPQLPYGPALPKTNTVTNPVINPVNPNPTQPTADEVARREAQVRNDIESGYGSYLSGLQGMMGTLGTNQTDEMGSASRTYEQIFGGLNDQKASNLAKLDANRTAVNTRQAQSIKDLQQNLSNTLRNASMQFGAMGAGDSSATRTMLPYAYTKMAGAQEGSIRNQANDQLFQIDQDAKDTESQFAQMWRQTEVDKESQLQNIRSYYGQAIQNIQMAMAQAPLEKSRDLASLSQSLLSEARQRLTNLETENRARQDSIRNWATERMSALNDYKLKLAGTANFSPQDIVWNELTASGQITPQSQQDNFYNPLALARQRRQEYLG